MDEPRWLVDEMLGRLCRYLRFLGYDAAYAQGVSDEAILQRAQVEGRRLLTRDRRLARHSPDAILLTRTDIAGQMQEIEAAFPSFRHQVRFERCSLCNGVLARVQGTPGVSPGAPPLPPEVLAGRAPAYRCSVCGHLYWEGAHTRSIRIRLAQWFPTTQGAG